MAMRSGREEAAKADGYPGVRRGAGARRGAGGAAEEGEAGDWAGRGEDQTHRAQVQGPPAGMQPPYVRFLCTCCRAAAQLLRVASLMLMHQDGRNHMS